MTTKIINLDWIGTDLYLNGETVGTVFGPQGENDCRANVRLPRRFASIHGKTIPEFISDAAKRGIKINTK